MKYLSIQTFQCGISVSGLATFTGGAEINILSLNGATTSSEASLFLGAHGTNEGGQLVLQKGTSNTYAAHLDNYADQFRLLYGTNTGSTGVALAVSLSTRQLILPAYTSTSSFSGTAVGYLAFDSAGNVITTASPAGAVTSIIAGTGVSVSSATGNVTISIGQSVATSAQVTFDSVITNNNGNGTNLKIGDDAWIGDVNAANTFRVTGAQNGANGYIIFGNSNFDALGRSGTGNLTYAGSTVWTAATLTDLSQLTNGPGYITSAALSGYVPTSRTLTINGTSYDLSADRTWTINTVDYTSRLQHQVKAGVAINKGQAVYVTSADGTNMIVGLASNASEATSSKTMGLLDATVAINGFANVVTEGLLAGLDTSTAGAAGDPVWLGTGGNLIYGLANKPYAPAHLVFIGIVTRKNNSNGEIFVKVQNGFELNEIHDVDIKTTVPVNGHILGFDGTLWVNKTIAGWLGYTPANASGTTNYISKFTGSTTLGNSLIYDDGSGVGIGTTSPSSKLSIVGPDNASGLGVLELVTSSTNLKLGGNFDYSWIQSHNSKPLRINELGNNVILNLGGGNTGIGTSSPSYKLDVYGSPRFYGDGNHMYARLSSGASNKDSYVVFNNTADRFYVGIPANSNNLYIQSGNGGTPVSLVADYTSGNVGIGTSIPVSKLHVLVNGNTSGGPAGNVASFQNSSVGNNAYITLFGSYNAESGIVFTDESEQYKGKIGYDNNTEHMYFQTDGSEKMRITSTGAVGIGTSSPGSMLHVAGAITSNASGIGTLNLGRDTNSGIYNTAQVIGQTSPSYTATGKLSFKVLTWGVGSDYGPTEQMYIDVTGADTKAATLVMLPWGGNVGIGTTNPLGKLHIADDGPNALRIGDTQVSTIGETNDGGYPGMKIVPYNSNIHIGISSTNDNKINLWHGGSNYTYWQQLSTYSIISNYSTNALVFQVNGGNVLIGTTTDAGYKLYVNGTGYFADNLKLQTGILSFDGVAGYWGNAIKYETGQLNLYQSGDLHLGVGGGNITLYKNTKIPHNQRFTAGGYSSTDGITIWGTQNASAGGDGFVGRNLYYNGTNYIYASTNDNSLWGTIAGMRVVGNSSNALEFIARPATNSGLDVVASDLDSYKRMVISYSGNVGIGTISPTSILDASVSSGATSGFRFKGWSDASTPYLLSLGTQTYQDIFQIKSVNGLVTMGIVGAVGSTPDLAFQTNSTERMRITSGGNVGIGTTSPSSLLNVVATGSAPAALTVQDGARKVKIGRDQIEVTDLSDAVSTMYLQPNANLVINANSGNVGIGTQPSQKLDVNGYAKFTSGIILDGGATSHYREFIWNTSGFNRWDLYVHGAEPGSNVGGDLFLARYADNGAYLANAVTFQRSTGNVGIGTTSPSYKLQVNADGAGLYVLGANTAPYTQTIASFVYGGNSNSINIENQAGKASIQARAGGSTMDLLLNPVSGNVGIGTGSPQTGFKLDVNGSTVTRGEIYSNSDIIGFGANENYKIAESGNTWLAKTTGGVGIGTTSPNFKLQVNHGTGAEYVASFRNTNDNLQLKIGTTTGNLLNIQGATISTNAVYNIALQAEGGNVGIGTTLPSQILHVAGNIRVTGAFYDSNNQAGSAGQILKSTGTGTDWVSLSEITGVDGSGTANYVTKWSDADTVTNSLIYDNGTNVGIGTTSPGYNFDVNGQVRVQDKLRVGTVNSGNGVVHMSSSATINPNTTTIVWAQNVSVGMCAFIEYYILNDTSLTDQRAGTIMVTWNQSGTPTIAHTETTTPDIGSTTSINFTSSLVGSDARINAVNSSANPYTIVMSYKYF